MATADEIIAVFRMCQANYQYAMRDSTPESISDLQVLWLQLLAPIDGTILKAAALQHVSESKWFPSIAELKAIAAEIELPQHKTAVEAWGEVVRAIHEVGYYRVPTFDDEAIAQTVRDLGWQNLCQSECSEADRARFIEGYNAYTKREHRIAVMPPEVARLIIDISERKQITGGM